MKILITGAKGMLGQALVERMRGNFEVLETDLHNLDVTCLEAVLKFCSRTKPEAIVHAAAFTQVDKAEELEAEAFRVNAIGTRNMAAAANGIGGKFVYFSTDYIFDGNREMPYREWDPPSPLSVYGRSKHEGEVFARDLCPRHLIIRTSWLFGPGGPNFVKTIARLAASRPELKIVDDQRGTPTYTVDLAEITERLLGRNVTGTYHVTNSESCSWFEFGKEIVQAVSADCNLTPISTSEFGAPAPRPAYSVLENYMLSLEGEELLRPWKEALKDYMKVGDV